MNRTRTPSHPLDAWLDRHPVALVLLGLAVIGSAIWLVFWPVGRWLAISLLAPVTAALAAWWQRPLIDWTTGQTLLVLLIVVAAIRAR